MAIKKQETNVHLRLEYSESVNAKKELLLGQVNLLKMAGRLEIYKKLRNEELILREKLRKEWTTLKTLIRQARNSLPAIETEEKIMNKGNNMTIINPARNKNLEEDLQSIQEKLKRLGI